MKGIQAGKSLTNPHPKGCFWHDMAETWGPPDIKYCEKTLCQFISEPANTWSNLSFIFVGLFLFFYLKKREETKSRFVELYGLNMLFVGATSFIYHLSNNFLTQFFDFLGMYAFFGLMLFGHLEYLGKISKGKVFSYYLLSFIPYSLLFLSFRYLGIPVQLSMVLVITGALGTLVALLLRWGKALPGKQILGGALLLFVAAFTCQLLDINRVWCDPDNHWLQLHALWHLLNGLGMGVLFFFYWRLNWTQDQAGFAS